LLAILKRFLNRFSIVRYLGLGTKNGALGQIGWMDVSFKNLRLSGKTSVPWFSYGAIDYITQTIGPSASILELGGGGSTRFWVERGNPVSTVESDAAWATIIKRELLEFPNLMGVFPETDISPETLNFLGDQNFDVIVNDFNGGIGRGSVVQWMVEHLNENGYIVWDNTDRLDCKDGLLFLESLGFGRISFFGLGPINHYAFETSILSKSIKSPSWPLPKRNTIFY
jgi:hypothetical protein